MNVELEVEEIVSRCVAVVVCYYHFARTWQDWAGILAKIRAISLDAESSEISVDSLMPLIRLELLERFDPEVAHRLSREFLDMLATVSSASRSVMTAGR